jgi:hypothetical protein
MGKKREKNEKKGKKLINCLKLLSQTLATKKRENEEKN